MGNLRRNLRPVARGIEDRNLLCPVSSFDEGVPELGKVISHGTHYAQTCNNNPFLHHSNAPYPSLQITFKGQYGFADTWKKQLFTAQMKKRFAETSEKNGEDPFPQIAGQRVSSNRVLALFKAASLQTLLNHPRREIAEMSGQII